MEHCLCIVKLNKLINDLQVPARLLMGPGPGNAHPRVLAAQSLPLLGHMVR
jgi:alanine-glyoxylate transaminase/serine-glyoxylate transaminase/serine-pyruvate transaminase